MGRRRLRKAPSETKGSGELLMRTRRIHAYIHTMGLVPHPPQTAEALADGQAIHANCLHAASRLKTPMRRGRRIARAWGADALRQRALARPRYGWR
eukprot:scaffold181749_cov31-Tisochrysis_lutea.AAC.2